MKIIITLDDRGGMAFNKRRQSRDIAVSADIEALVGENTLFIEPYSAELFSEASLNIILSQEPERLAEEDDYIFLETRSPEAAIAQANEIVIYKWNRRYPFDVSLNFSPEPLGFKLKSTHDFKGNSHEKITREVYVK